MTQPRVLVIDDSPNDLTVARRFLERAGYQVQVCTSGEQGLDLARSVAPDCVVVDFRMPMLDGREVIRRLKADESLRNIPVIMLTGANQPEDIAEGLNAGAEDYVGKGEDPRVLLARVKNQIRLKTAQDQLRTHAARMENERNIAVKVQESLLPKKQFHAPGVEIRSAYIPSEQLSGDFFDYVLSDGLLYMLMADVSGHGLPAAILVSLLKSYLHTEATEKTLPAAVLSGLNDFLFSASLPSQFATAQLFRFDQAERLVRVSNAAHPPFLFYRRRENRTEMLEHPSHLLGAIAGMDFDESSFSVEAGDILFSYTDGLTDRRAVSGEFYSLDRISALLEGSGSADFNTVYDRVMNDVSGFANTEEYKDDVAFILARFD